MKQHVYTAWGGASMVAARESEPKTMPFFVVDDPANGEGRFLLLLAKSEDNSAASATSAGVAGYIA